MGKVHLVQYLCPQRHCIMAAAYVAGESCRADCEAGIREKVAAYALHPWCGVCGSRELVFEDATTPFDSLEAAMPSLLECQRQQMITRAVMNELGMTFDGPDPVPVPLGWVVPPET